MQTIVTDIIGTLVRSVLAILGGWMLATGFFTEATVAQFIVAATAVVIAVVWGIVNKFVWNKTVETALELPANSSPSKLQEVLDAK